MKKPALQNKQFVVLRMAFRDFRETGPWPDITPHSKYYSLRCYEICSCVKACHRDTSPLLRSPFTNLQMHKHSGIFQCNRVDVRVIDHKQKRIYTIEMSCPWIDNRKKKEVEKTIKYAPPSVGTETAIPNLHRQAVQHHY